MPSKLESGTYKYSLNDDASGTVFTLARLSCREREAVDDAFLQVRFGETSAAKIAGLEECLRLAVKGWSLDQEFSIDTLRDVCTRRECMELIGEVITESALTPDERKKFESPPKSGTD
jgi:hypothetical protein